MFSAGESYERYMGRWSRRLAPAHLAFVDARDGQRFLDVGTGTGAVAATIAAALPSSEVLGIDPSEAFVAHAERHAASARVRFEVGDAQALRFADASFDQTLALLAMNFIPDPARALGEMRRVTRPGGVVSAAVWDYAEGMESLRYFWDEVVALDPALAPKHERNMKLCRAGQLAELWRNAGLAAVDERPLQIEQPFASFADYWGPFLAGTGPGGACVASLPEARRLQLEARLRDRLLGTGEDAPLTLRARAWSVRGTVPPG